MVIVLFGHSILFECGLLTNTVGNPHCDMTAGRIKPASDNLYISS